MDSIQCDLCFIWSKYGITADKRDLGELFLGSLIFVSPAEKTGASFWGLEKSTLQSSYSNCGWEGNDSKQIM